MRKPVGERLVSAEPLVQDVVGLGVTVVPQLTAGVLPVPPAVEVGQPPALGEDGAGQVRSTVIEVSEQESLAGTVEEVR